MSFGNASFAFVAGGGCGTAQVAKVDVTTPYCPPGRTVQGLVFQADATQGLLEDAAIDIAYEEVAPPLVSSSVSATSDNTGSYSATVPVSNLTINCEFDQTPEECGVTVADLLLMQKHILGTQSLTHTWQYLAGDANQDDKLSVIDMIRMRKAILRYFSPRRCCTDELRGQLFRF